MTLSPIHYIPINGKENYKQMEILIISLLFGIIMLILVVVKNMYNENKEK